MDHRYSLDGYGYRLRPVKRQDAQFIIDVRLEDPERNRFIHAISGDIAEQERWLDAYFQREGDYYFVVENRLTRQPEGVIGFYNEQDGSAEWGRWVLKRGSLAAAESVYLLYQIAFTQVGLRELYCRTIEDNAEVVSFHRSIGELTRAVLPDFFELYGVTYHAVEQYATHAHFDEHIAPRLERQAAMVFRRNFKRLVGRFEFHHIGVATKGLEREFPAFSLLGYEKDGPAFEDHTQGIRGQFLTARGQPRLELLAGLEGSDTLTPYLSHNAKLYHSAYLVDHMDKAIEVLVNCRAKIVSPPKASTYFGKRICFLMLPNMMLIELVEE